MSEKEMIARLMAGSYKGQKIVAVDYDRKTSPICDIWLWPGDHRVTFSTIEKAVEWVIIDEIVELTK